MAYAEVTDMKPEAQVHMLKDLCKKISDVSDDWLQENAEVLLDAIVTALNEQNGDDAWGTEGWEHFFGYE